VNTKRRALAVAVVNGVVVLLLPLVAATLRGPRFDSTVHPPEWSPVAGFTRKVVTAAMPMAPWGLIAAWRSWAHASRWSQGDRGWMGVTEAGACGFLFATLVLLPGLWANLLAAPIYLAIYGVVGWVAGICVGLVLQLAGAIIMSFPGRR
jgi:hypothetical protein